MNSITIEGHLGADARTPNSSTPMVTLRVASREGKDETMWVDVVVFGTAVPFAAKLKKGAYVVIFGRLRSREYEGVTKWEIVASTVQSPRAQATPTTDDGLPF